MKLISDYYYKRLGAVERKVCNELGLDTSDSLWVYSSVSQSVFQGIPVLSQVLHLDNMGSTHSLAAFWKSTTSISPEYSYSKGTCLTYLVFPKLF